MPLSLQKLTYIRANRCACHNHSQGATEAAFLPLNEVPHLGMHSPKIWPRSAFNERCCAKLKMLRRTGGKYQQDRILNWIMKSRNMVTPPPLPKRIVSHKSWTTFKGRRMGLNRGNQQLLREGLRRTATLIQHWCTRQADSAILQQAIRY